MTLYFLLLSFFVYGFLGWCTEVVYAAMKEGKFVNRGFLNGPICPIYGIGVCVVVQFLAPFKSNLFILYVMSVIVVTALEWLTGFLLEKFFHNKWWDYSQMPLNLNGYVCLLFSVIWGIACVLIVKFIDPLIQKGLGLLPHTLGILLLIILGAVVFADLYVTAAGILKMNRHLAKMESIASELRNMSEQIGENIFKGVKETMEKLDQQENMAEDMKTRVKVLRQKYQELDFTKSGVHKRLTKAFPKMSSLHYKEAMKEMKAFIRREKK